MLVLIAQSQSAECKTPPPPPQPLPPPPPRQHTCHIDLYQARASADAVGGVAYVRAADVVRHGPLEEKSIVSDFHVFGHGSIQPVSQRGQKCEMQRSKYLSSATRSKIHKITARV